MDEGKDNDDSTPQDIELQGDQNRLAEVELLHAPPGSVLFKLHSEAQESRLQDV